MREVSHTLYTYIHRTTTTDPRAENGEISTPLRKKEPSSSYFLWSRHSLPLVRNERRGSCCVLVQGRLALASAPPAPSQKGRKGLVLSHKKNQISIKSPTSPVEQHKKPRAFIQPDGTEVVVVPTTNRHRAPRVPNTSHGMAHVGMCECAAQRQSAMRLFQKLTSQCTTLGAKAARRHGSRPSWGRAPTSEPVPCTQ